MSILGNKFPSNVFTPAGPDGATRTMSMVFLQGWGFFTRDAREDRVSVAIMQHGASTWEILDQDSIVQPKYMFGLSRLSRAESVDINVLYSAIDEDAEWVECPAPQDLTGCIEPLVPITRVALSPARPEPLCASSVALVRQTPIPYGYRELTRTKQTRVLALTVDCDV
ncbi:SdpA family antimicrobial peptide system protein [Leifsonia shinshuensis]|uniref:Antimicrobial peptide system SdpA family protein n=1 Tax=Leifsonia shinshuensis TaxID=150026 RepID=A0A853CRJ5_9MICO|nr:SdpA family antimicrobial peptide system protein [Leifsonia shinshuensis]NYJ23556.1 antimicrobial peptide system SdpA family protein [Leifsonia shinshuensis]